MSARPRRRRAGACAGKRAKAPVHLELTAHHPVMAGASSQLVVRCYRHETDAPAVRRIWSTGLLQNIHAFGYPPSLVAEEESFVADTLAEGDMVDLQSAYQSHPQGRTGFWVVTPQGSGGTAQEPVGCIGLRLGKGENVGDIGRFTVDFSFRGQGAARLLLSTLEAHAKRAKFTHVTATTSALNTSALGAFGACGYEEVYRGRMDKKPAPEWVPFVRLQKVLSLVRSRTRNYPIPCNHTRSVV